jgi:ElaB/YqjD/DUF883 family membrane-anchored ribosome-binding protein
MSAEVQSKLMLGVSIPINCSDDWNELRQKIEDILESQGMQYTYEGNTYQYDAPDAITIGEELLSIPSKDLSVESYMEELNKIKEQLEEKMQNKQKLIDEINECIKLFMEQIEGDIQFIEELNVINCVLITD